MCVCGTISDEREISPTHKFYASLGDDDIEEDANEEVSGDGVGR